MFKAARYVSVLRRASERDCFRDPFPHVLSTRVSSSRKRKRSHGKGLGHRWGGGGGLLGF